MLASVAILRCIFVGQTPAHLACYHGEVNCLKILLDSGCDVTIRDLVGRTCLDMAMMTDQTSVLG